MWIRITLAEIENEKCKNLNFITTENKIVKGAMSYLICE